MNTELKFTDSLHLFLSIRSNNRQTAERVGAAAWRYFSFSFVI